MFCNLKSYTDYSIEFGVIKINDLIDLNKKNKYMAVTDRNNISSSVKFFNLSILKNIKAIIGCELLFKDDNFGCGYFTILVTNELGYKNICFLINSSWRRFKTKNLNFINKKDVKNHNKGLIFFTGGYYSFGRGFLFDSKIEKLSNKIDFIKKIIPNNFFIEIQRFDNFSKKESEKLIYLSCFKNVPLVANHPFLFKKEKDFFTSKSKFCIYNKEYYKKSSFEKKISKKQFFLDKDNIINLFKDIPQALKNTIIIAKSCKFKFSFKSKFPVYYKIKNKKSAFRILKKKIFKLFKNSNYIYIKRIIFELSIIKKTNFSNFFLIVENIVNWSKKKKIQIGPGRGSSSSSLISFILKITEVDPIKNNLFFERFLNESKNSMPDFDVDFCPKKRKLVFEYIKKKYGKNNVLNIITFGKFGSKTSIRDSGRILGYNFLFINKMSNLFVDKKKIFENIKINKEISKIKAEKNFKKILKIAIKLETKVRNLSLHAGGVIIFDSIKNPMPFYILKNKKKTIKACQFDKNDIEELGFLKFDMLGLKTLTVLKDIKKKLNIFKNFFDLDFKDKNVLSLIKKSDTNGIFQLESDGIKNLIKKIRPNNFNDLISIVSIYRPGPIDLIKDYCFRRKSNKIKYINSKFKKILKKTYGLIFFQEQIIKIIEECTKLSLNNSEKLRKLILKSSEDNIEIIKKKFIENIKEEYKIKSNYIFSMIKRFSGYSFNKAHAVSYSMITFYMAFLKCYHFIDFIVSNLNVCLDDNKRICKFYKECVEKNVKFVLPDINKSNFFFSRIKKKIIYGLGAIKGNGKKSSKYIIKERKKRKFNDFFDFYYRIDRKYVNKKNIESLIFSGCFDKTNKNRSHLISFINKNKVIKSNINQKRMFNFIIKISTKNLYLYKEEYKSLGFFKNNPVLKIKKYIKNIIENRFNYYYGVVVNLTKFDGNYKVYLQFSLLIEKIFFIEEKKFKKLKKLDIILLFLKFKRIEKIFRININGKKIEEI